MLEEKKQPEITCKHVRPTEFISLIFQVRLTHPDNAVKTVFGALFMPHSAFPGP